MYFKQIEMTGFKSFADRTMVRLEEGITSIVGPNGCGKSNILDAMRWALGEQSARELRGAHMHDVIFNGSENRHALGMAEVSLLFDNADSHLPVDFAEVEVTRRVYRSGESEYLINKTPCRLADIREMFMDTGVGTQAYSMVGQGKMDMLLSSKPDERRYVFEEAAGVHKYKSRKRVAMRRLGSAEQNLLRLADIITEVQRQMRSLKRQVNAAIRYREYSEQLREFEIRGAWLQFAHLSTEIASLRSQFAEAQDAYEKLSTEQTALEARNEELNLASLELQRVLLARREGVHDIDTGMEKIERQIALLRQQVEFAERQREQAAEERKGFLQRADAIQTRIQDAAKGIEQYEEQMAAHQQTLESKQGDHDETAAKVHEADGRVQTLREQAVERMNQRNETLTEVETLGVRVTNVDTQLEAICTRQDADNTRRETVAAALQEMRSTESDRSQSLEQSEAALQKAHATRAEKEEQLRETNSVWQGHREEKSRLEARLHSLRELRDNYEGFAGGVRAVMRAKAEGVAEAAGVVGPAGDLIATDKDFERAIEAALGGNINNVVVQDGEGAKAAISHLEKNKAGRVTFLPLDMVRGGRGKEFPELAAESGVIGAALDKVQFDESNRPAVENLLHSTVIVETLDDAIRIARSKKAYPRLVTLRGEVVTSAGAVTGGRTRHDSRGLLGRSAEITELEEKVVAVDATLEQVAADRQALADSIEALRGDISQHESSATALRAELNELGVSAARHAADLESLAESVERLDDQRTDLAAQREDLDARRQEAVARADSLESDDEALQQQLTEAQDSAFQMRQDLTQRANELADLRVALAEVSQHLEEAQRVRTREERDHEVALEEAERRTALDGELISNMANVKEEIENQIERSKALSENKDEAREKVVEAENQQQEVTKDAEAVDTRLRGLRSQTRDAQNAVHNIELALRKDEERIGFFQERIQTEYNVALPSLTAEDVGEDEHDDKTRDKMVADFRQKLQRMGDVNLMAIEEFEELEKRDEFLVSQQTDLEQAREALLGVIERSDTKIREMFMETFTQVGHYFRDNFRRLFGGGQARVYLLDEDDPLESGIEIEARPPGKKPQSISLLSGGERALTAVALLFSIFRAKPSPFCVLDEVDAPLDDANIGRFCEILEEFATRSQFVVITHNKQTMARADVLYGVTQQERGVSELVSVRFEDGDEAPV
jgi:chromosome segregation protein